MSKTDEIRKLIYDRLPTHTQLVMGEDLKMVIASIASVMADQHEEVMALYDSHHVEPLDSYEDTDETDVEYCTATDKGYWCTLAPEHKGIHEAMGAEGREPYHTWAQEESV